MPGAGTKQTKSCPLSSWERLIIKKYITWILFSGDMQKRRKRRPSDEAGGLIRAGQSGSWSRVIKGNTPCSKVLGLAPGRRRPVRALQQKDASAHYKEHRSVRAEPRAAGSLNVSRET